MEALTHTERGSETEKMARILLESGGNDSFPPPFPDSDLLPVPDGYEEYPYNICNKVDEKITRREQKWCCYRFNRLEEIAKIETRYLEDVNTRQAKIGAVKATLRQHIGPGPYEESVRNQAGPYSKMILSLQRMNPKAYASALRAWKVFDLLLASEDHCDLMLETLLVQIYTRFINVEVEFGNDAYAWNVFDVRSFLSIVCCSSKDEKNPFYLSEVSDQRTVINLANAEKWSRTEEVLEHETFWNEETNLVTQLKHRRNNADYLFSRQIKLRIDYYTDLYRVMRTYESFSQVMSQLFLFLTENPYDNEKLGIFDHFVDQVATYTMDNFSEFVYKLPPFRDFVQFALEPLSKYGRRDWKEAVHWKVLDARDDSASLWDFKGNRRKHYLYRKIDIFDFEKRTDFVNQIVQCRFKDERRKAEEAKDEHRLFLFLARVQHYMYGMDLIPPELFESDESEEQVNVFDFEFIKYFFYVIDYRELNSITLWTLDAIMDIVLGRKDFITPDRVKDYKMELGSDAENPDYEKELREDDPIVQQTDKVLRQLFTAFTSYNPERMRDLRNDSQQAVELVKKYSFQKRLQANLDRLNLNTKNPIGTFGDDWGAEPKSFTDPDVVEEVKRLTPFLDHNRRLVERIREFDDDWKFIQKLCRLDVVPWLFINMMTGKVTDPSSGNTYGYPGSNAHKSEIQRRLAGIPSMYWYADPPVRSMPRVDIRRLHGGDGFLFAPRIIPPTSDDDWIQWVEEVKTYEELVGRLTPFEMAEMFAYNAPPTQLLMKKSFPEFVEAKDLLKRSNADQALVRQKGTTLADIWTQRLVTDDFNLESGVTLSEAARYIERWWDKNATLMSDMPSGKDGVQIIRSAISGAQAKERFLDQWERMQEFKTKENQLEREYARGQGTLEQQMKGRMERYEAFKKQREKLAQHLDDLKEGRISDPVILKDYQDFKKKSEEKWNQLSPRYDDPETYDLTTGDGMNTVPFFIFGRFIGELMDDDEAQTFIKKFKAKYGNNVYEDDDDDNTTMLDINDRYMFAWFMRSSSLNDAVWKDWLLEYSDKAPYMPFDVYQSKRRLPTLKDAFDDPKTGTLRRREYDEGMVKATDDDTKRQRLPDGSKSGGRDIGTFFNQFCRRMANMRIKF